MSTPPGNPSDSANVTHMASDTRGTEPTRMRPAAALPSASEPTVTLDGTESWLSTQTTEDADAAAAESVERGK
jgi:hypothetical protein